jgi:hypothetical protein
MRFWLPLSDLLCRELMQIICRQLIVRFAALGIAELILQCDDALTI